MSVVPVEAAPPPVARMPAEIEIIRGVLGGFQRSAPRNERCVVFVHGLTGDRTATWKEKSSAIGFVELLRTDPELEDFDVFTFGYRTTYLRGAPINSAANQLAHALEELSRQQYQIVLIAHSMGGLVCMRYILDQLERGVRPPISGLLLYGTPTTGSDLLKAAKLVGYGLAIKFPPLRWALNLFLRGQRQIADLETGSNFLTGLHTGWAFRVVNGGHESAGDNRMWLPVRVVTGEDDLFVTEISGKGVYGAIDWRSLSYTHVQLVKPSAITDDRYKAAQSFLRLCRAAPRRDILDSIWKATQSIWKSRELRVSNALRFATLIRKDLSNTNQDSGALADFASCRTSCEYNFIPEESSIDIGVTISDLGASEVWSRKPEPVYVHQIGLQFLLEKERNGLQGSLNKLLTGLTPEQAWSALFPNIAVRINGQELVPGDISHQPLGIENTSWLVRTFVLPEALVSGAKKNVNLKIEYESIVPKSLAHFTFSAPWTLNGVNLNIAVEGNFEYFVPLHRLVPGAESIPRTEPGGDRQVVAFSHPGIMLPGSFVEVRWRRR